MIQATSDGLTATSAPRGLTRRHQEVFEFICSSLRESGVSPSYEEIAQHLGVEATEAVAGLVRELEAAGAIVLRDGEPRSAVPVTRNAITVSLPDPLERAVRVIAQRAHTTPEAVVAEAVHERLSGICEALAAPVRPGAAKASRPAGAQGPPASARWPAGRR
jgi:hypothetical protein